MTEPYPQAQIDALVGLLKQLQQELPNLHFIAGHEDLDRDQETAFDDPNIMVARKLDPGPLFPWPEVMRQVKLERLEP
jgi:N-acetylmuramoyl-L-alanine amidase